MDERSSGKPEVLCRVCGDKASGKHYGVASCDGCRGFFKRSIRRNLEYICKENGRCIVDVTRRNQCQACRFRKCLQVNMKKDAVQHERAPRSCIPSHSTHQGGPLSGHILPLPFPSATLARRLHGSFFTSGLPLQTGHHFFNHTTNSNFLSETNTSLMVGGSPYFNQGLIYSSMLANSTNHAFRTKGVTTSLSPQNNGLLVNAFPRQTTSNDNEVSSSEEAATHSLNTNILLDNDIRLKSLSHTDRRSEAEGCRAFFSHPSTELSYLSLLPTENVYESAAKLLFLSVKWARTIPSFLQLSSKDQTSLLEESWTELFILTAAQWSLPIDDGALINNAQNLNSSQPSSLEDDARKLREVITRLNTLQIDHTEYACLKALVLFKPDCRNLNEIAHVELLQDQTHIMLQEYCNSGVSRVRLNGEKRIITGAVRFGKLLLTLPTIQGISKRSLEELLFKKTVGDVAIERLLVDMVKTSGH